MQMKAPAFTAALPSSAVSLPRFRTKLEHHPPQKLWMFKPMCYYDHWSYPAYAMKLQRRVLLGGKHKVKLQMNDGMERLWEYTPHLVKRFPWKRAEGIVLKVQLQINNAMMRLWEDVPDMVKDFPWKTAEGIVLQRLLFLALMALKWVLLALFIFSFVSDIGYSISRNKELMIPCSLFAGCMMADFLKEVSQDLLDISKESALKLQLLGIGCFFVAVKFITTYMMKGGQVFFLHIANGGLMQLLWLWKKLVEERVRHNGEDSLVP